MLDLLLGKHSPLLFSVKLFLLHSLLLLLPLHSEVSHMLLVDVGLLVQGGALMGKVSLLVCVPRIVLKFGHQRL